MKIIDDFASLAPFPNAVVTIGTFDGVHLGHQKILKRIIDLANKTGGSSVLITFWPHPRFVLGRGWGDLKLLTTFHEKAGLLLESGIDYLIKIPFTRDFSELSSRQFIEKVLVQKIGTKKLVIGYDHKFGRNREGSFEYLKKHQSDIGFSIEEISRRDIDNVGVSSTKIRQALSVGRVVEASKLLGRNYMLRGLVVKGDQMGRQLGFPTANIYIAEEFKLIPGDGVYAVYIHVKDEVFTGMMNIGIRPTLSGTRKQIETNIFDFDRDIYGQNIKIAFVEKLRGEFKFRSRDALVKQLHSDKQAAVRIFSGL